MTKQAMNVTVKTVYISSSGNEEERNVTLWVNPDKSVTLLGGIYHGNTVIVDQELVDNLQKIVDATKENKS